MGNNEFNSAKQQALRKYFGRLNDMQKNAVFTVNGPVLILAGAGSGKTSVLVNRIVNMVRFGNAYYDTSVRNDISDDDIKFLSGYNGENDENIISRLSDLISVNCIKPWNILVITFTNKAAGELKERLEASLGSSASDINASTFHSACVRILRRYIDRLGYNNNFTIYDGDDSIRLLKSCYDANDLSDKMFPPKSVISVISSAKDKLVSPQVFEAQAAGDFRKIAIAKLYREYQNRLKAANAVDFDDIIVLTVSLLENNPDVLEYYRNRFKYVMVDEYQDTNHAQYRLISLLAGKHENLCVVGDDDQSIYKFRGATVANILEFENQFDNAAVIRLEQNYRSTSNILNTANSVILNNSSRKPKKLWTSFGTGEKVIVYKAFDEMAESRFVADKILEGVKNGMSCRDFAVLYRMNAQSNSLEKAMTQSGIQYRVIGGLRFYDRKEIRDIVAYLSVINNDRDMLRFKRIINEPKRGLGDSTVALIEQMSSDMNESPVTVMENAESFPMLSKKSSSLVKTAQMFRKLKNLSGNTPLDAFLDKLLDITGYKTYMESLGEEGVTRMENINELKSNMVAYMEGKGEGEEYSLSEFLEEISLYTDADRLDPNADAVSMMTMHSAKGLEFDTVFIVGAEEGLFPGSRSLENPDDIEEERRLAYVAITRAKKRLYISHASQRMLFGSTGRNIVSRFIREISPEYIEKIDSTVRIYSDDDKILTSAPRNLSLQSQIASNKTQQRKKNNISDFNAGDRVRHNIFGDGIIISAKAISNDMMLEVAFDNVGTKKLMANYAKIVKL